jgi:hypothetical protein
LNLFCNWSALLDMMENLFDVTKNLDQMLDKVIGYPDDYYESAAKQAAKEYCLEFIEECQKDGIPWGILKRKMFDYYSGYLTAIKSKSNLEKSLLI